MIYFPRDDEILSRTSSAGITLILINRYRFSEEPFGIHQDVLGPPRRDDPTDETGASETGESMAAIEEPTVSTRSSELATWIGGLPGAAACGEAGARWSTLASSTVAVPAACSMVLWPGALGATCCQNAPGWRPSKHLLLRCRS